MDPEELARLEAEGSQGGGTNYEEAQAEAEAEAYEDDEPQYDEDGNLLEEPAPEPEPPSQEVTPYRPAPPVYNHSGLSDEERQQLNDLALVDPVSAFEQVAARMQAQARQEQAITNYHLAQAQEQSPEFARVHYAGIQEGLQGVSPELRGTPEALIYGMVYALGKEAMGTKDFLGSLKRAVTLIEGGTAAPQPRAQPARQAVPPSKRTTSPQVPAAATRAPQLAPTQARRGPNSEVKNVMALAGVDEETARAIVRETNQAKFAGRG